MDDAAVGGAEVRAFVEELYSTVRSAVAPTPLYEITDDTRVEVDYIAGRGQLPAEDATEITVMDVNIASLFFDDFHVLYEGDTGAGKTYGSETVFETVFGREGYYSLQLREDMLGASPTDPFTRVEQEGGMPKMRVDEEACRQYGGMFVDEINRARDTNEVIGVVDGEVQVNGDRARLGLPIPGTDRVKGLAIIAAMNPADAEYTDTRQLDLAGENRWVKFPFPDNVDESGAGQLGRDRAPDMHETFWDAYRERTGMDGSWRELFPVVADPAHVSNGLNGQVEEFVDALIGFVGRDPATTYDRNTALIEDCGYTPSFDVEDDGNYLEKVQEAQGQMRHEFGRRDLEQVYDTSQLLGFITGVKDGSFDIGASLTDVVAATGIVAEGKTVTGTEYGQLVGLVDDARAAYDDVVDQFEDVVDHGEVPDGRGIRETAWQAAVMAGVEDGFDTYLESVQDKLAGMNTYTGNSAEAAVRSRVVADLAVLESFSERYRDELEDVLAEAPDYETALGGFADTVASVDRSIGEHRAVYDRLSFCRGGGSYDG